MDRYGRGFGAMAAARVAGLLLAGCCLAPVARAQGTVARPANEPAAPAAGDPVTRSSYFFVGGRYQKVGEKNLMVGQMFVEVRTPAKVTQPYPVVLVHGLAQSGLNFMTTPDGRSGWAQRFVEWGYQVYVVDQVGRGRSGTNPEVYGPYDRFGTRELERTFTAPEVYDLYPQAKLHTQWPGGAGVQGNASFDQYFASQVPYLANSQQTEDLVDTALGALLDRTGPVVLVTHGQGALFGWALSDSHPDLVKAHIAVEPGGPPFFDVKVRGGKDFWEKTGEGRARAYGITRMPLTFEPPVKTPEDLAVVQQAKAAGDGQIRCWLQGDPVRTLPNIAKVPAVIVTAEASFHAAYDDCTAAFLTQAGAKPDVMHLADQKVRGNGHMVMVEKNSDLVADTVMGWLSDRFRR